MTHPLSGAHRERVERDTPIDASIRVRVAEDSGHGMYAPDRNPERYRCAALSRGGR
jgi:hypothetical protein